MIQQGLLDEKGKPNDKTPADWRQRYRQFSHFGEASGSTSEPASSTPVAEAEEGQEVVDTQEEAVEEGVSKKKKKKKKKQEEDE